MEPALVSITTVAFLVTVEGKPAHFIRVDYHFFAIL
jgi:hypothetical protein